MKVLKEIITTLVLALLIFAFLRFTVQSFKVEGESMKPGIHHGQYLLVNKATYFFRPPQRGEIIVFHSPYNPKADYIKRVIALPGDSVEVRNNKVFVNGTALTEPYIAEPPHYTIPQKEILPDRYFVLGDNRNHSQDSHNGWTVGRDQIVGKAWITLWPPQKWGLIKHYPLSLARVTEPLRLTIAWQRP